MYGGTFFDRRGAAATAARVAAAAAADAAGEGGARSATASSATSWSSSSSTAPSTTTGSTRRPGVWETEAASLPSSTAPAVRVGWANECATGHASMGFDQHSYCYASTDGSRIHQSARSWYGRPYGHGDVIGCMISFEAVPGDGGGSSSNSSSSSSSSGSSNSAGTGTTEEELAAAEERDDGASAGPCDGQRQLLAARLNARATAPAAGAGTSAASGPGGVAASTAPAKAGSKKAAASHASAAAVAAVSTTSDSGNAAALSAIGSDVAIGLDGGAEWPLPPAGVPTRADLTNLLLYNRAPPLPPPWETSYKTLGRVREPWVEGDSRVAGGSCRGGAAGSPLAAVAAELSSRPVGGGAGDKHAALMAQYARRSTALAELTEEAAAAWRAQADGATGGNAPTRASGATRRGAAAAAAPAFPELTASASASASTAASGPPNGKKTVNRRFWRSTCRFFVNGVDQGVAFVHVTQEGE